jgi:prepilin-type N-terminal cleavage/methylation domain-containing protein
MRSLGSPCVRIASSFRIPTGFSLVELLVALAIVAILAALALSVGRGMILRGQKAASASNLRQIGAAMMARVKDHGGYLPPPRGRLKDGSNTQVQFWWSVHLLPYTDGNVKVFDRPGMTTTWDDPIPSTPPRACPSAPVITSMPGLSSRWLSTMGRKAAFTPTS